MNVTALWIAVTLVTVASALPEACRTPSNDPTIQELCNTYINLTFEHVNMHRLNNPVVDSRNLLSSPIIFFLTALSNRETSPGALDSLH